MPYTTLEPLPRPIDLETNPPMLCVEFLRIGIDFTVWPFLKSDYFDLAREMAVKGEHHTAFFLVELIKSYSSDTQAIYAGLEPVMARRVIRAIGLERFSGTFAPTHTSVTLVSPMFAIEMSPLSLHAMLDAIPNTGEWFGEVVQWLERVPAQTMRWVRAHGIPSNAVRRPEVLARALSGARTPAPYQEGRAWNAREAEIKSGLLELVALFGKHECGRVAPPVTTTSVGMPRRGGRAGRQ